MTSRENATAASSIVVDSGLRHWNSPIPYLFGGVALMLGLITVALVILACTNRVYSSSSSSDHRTTNSSGAAGGVQLGDQKKPVAELEVVIDSDEPKVVVIMAGDITPTYLANPVTCLSDGDRKNHGDDRHNHENEISSS